jgi:hypothetical protein
MSTIYGGNSDRPQNIYTFAPITNVGTSEVIEIDGTTITSLDVVTGGQVTHQLQGSMDGVNWAGLESAKTRESGNHLGTYSGYAVRYLRVVVSASHATRTLTATICCDA